MPKYSNTFTLSRLWYESSCIISLSHLIISSANSNLPHSFQARKRAYPFQLILSALLLTLQNLKKRLHHIAAAPFLLVAVGEVGNEIALLVLSVLGARGALD